MRGRVLLKGVDGLVHDTGITQPSEFGPMLDNVTWWTMCGYTMVRRIDNTYTITCLSCIAASSAPQAASTP